VLAVLLALFTPIADPARIGVSSQMARLEKGKTKAADFDFRYLRFEGGRYGRAALEELKQRSTGADAALLQRSRRHAGAGRQGPLDAAEKRHRAGLGGGQPDGVAGRRAAAGQLPRAEWEAMQDNQKPDCLSKREGKCDAFLIDADGDGRRKCC
jgi:hypothetical protein